MRPMLLALSLLAVACNGAAQAESPPPAQDAEASTPAARATWIEAATIARSSASLQLTLPGEVEGSKDALLASSQGGYVEAALVEVGDTVKKGDPLFHIDRGLYQARIAQIQAEVKAARRELDRAKRLGSAIASAEVDAAHDRLVSAQASARVAKIQLNRATVRAPFDGALAAVSLEVGEVAGPGTPAARLVVLDPVKVTISVADRDVGLLEAGTEVRVAVDALAEPRVGTIARILPAADIDTRAFFVEIEVPNEDAALLPGMIARVSVEQSLREDAILIPQGFLVTQRESNGVFVVEDGVARWRPLQLGPLVRDQVVIEGGLEVGENIVVVGQRALADGDAVILSRQGTCCTQGRPKFGS
ncbi:MAG: efflux RND transporter periplasmic adaptor subunit [Myxococcota bacterium]